VNIISIDLGLPDGGVLLLMIKIENQEKAADHLHHHMLVADLQQLVRIESITAIRVLLRYTDEREQIDQIPPVVTIEEKDAGDIVRLLDEEEEEVPLLLRLIIDEITMLMRSRIDVIINEGDEDITPHRHYRLKIEDAGGEEDTDSIIDVHHPNDGIRCQWQPMWFLGQVW
jgi:hypothetical protein